MKHLTIVYNLPDDFDCRPLTQNKFSTAFAWSHKMDECNALRAALEIANARAGKFEREWHLRGKALADWQRFGSDVVPGCAASADWLDGLRKQTAELLGEKPERVPSCSTERAPRRKPGQSGPTDDDMPAAGHADAISWDG